MDIMKMGKNPNYLGSWDLEDTPNNELTLTIKAIMEDSVIGEEGRKETCCVCHFVEPNYKPMILNLTNKKTLIKLYKTSDSGKLAGKRVTIITRPVRAFGAIYDALRIKPVVPPAPAPNEVCEVCGGPILPASGMTSKQIADYGRQKFGKAMCAKCAKEASAKPKKEEPKKDATDEG